MQNAAGFKKSEIGLRLAEVQAALQEGLLIFDDGRVNWANERAAETLGYAPAELVGLAWGGVIKEPAYQEVVDELTKIGATKDNGAVVSITNKLVRFVSGEGGHGRSGRASIAVTVGAPGNRLRLTMSLTDITEELVLDERLHFLSRAVDQGFAAVAITDRDGRFEFVNRRFAEICGYDADSVLGRGIDLLESGDSNVTTFKELQSAIEEGRPWRGEIRATKRNGVLFWLATILSPITREDTEEIDKCVLIFDDITERKETEHQIWRQANFDQLTGLPNRTLFQDRLDQALVRAARAKEEVGLMFIDLNRFKLVNDTLGHDAGDELLSIVAGRLQSCLRVSDTIGRVGGDEFVALLPNPGGREDIEMLSQRILDKVIENCIVLGKHEVSVGCSIGLALFPDDGGTAEKLTKAADTAMYRAKETGRNAYRFFEPDMIRQGQEAVTLEAELRDAVAAKHFTMYYQPVVDAGSGRVTSAECLLRWLHPRKGVLRPAQFMEMAERMQLIGEIGDIVFERALGQLQEWRHNGVTDLHLSINVDRTQIIVPGFVETVVEKLQTYDIPPSSIAFEINEMELAKGLGSMKSVLYRLRDEGVGIALNDFGAGTLSLIQLRQLPVDTLKLDRAFVRDIFDDPANEKILDAVVGIARQLNLTVVAGAIEMKEQLKVVAEKDYDQFQGYLIGEPLPADEFLALKQRVDQDPSAWQGEQQA